MEIQPQHHDSQEQQDNTILQPDFSNEPTNNKEPINVDNEAKPGIFTLIIGIILLIRGFMRLNDGGALNIFGILMIAIGLVSLFVYFRKRF